MPSRALVVSSQGMQRMTDEELMRLTQNGSRAAFDVLGGRYRPRMRRVAGMILRHDDDAEDATQDALVDAYSKCRTFAFRSEVSGWLYRVAFNRSLLTKQRRARHWRRLVLSLSDSTTWPQDEEWQVSSAAGPSDECEARELQRYVASLLRSLPSATRTVYVMRTYQGWTPTQIGELLQVTVPAVKSRLQRANAQVLPPLIAYLNHDVRSPGSRAN